MSELLDLYDAVDGAEARSRAREWLRGAPRRAFEVATALAELGRDPSSALTAAVQEEAELTRSCTPADAQEELTRMLVKRDVHLALQWLHVTGVLAIWIPEIEATVNFSQEAGRKHKDVWEHTKQVVRQAVPRPAVRWGALLHDIGKVKTRGYLPDGGVHFHGHAEVGARMFEPVARRFAFDKPTKHKIRFLILHHLRANQYADGWTDSAVRRFDREMGEHLVDLLDLSRADITSKRPGRRQELLQQIHDLQERIKTLRELDAKLPPLPTGLGTAITARFGIPPSRRIGDLKRAMEEAVERGELEERRDDDYYLDWLAQSGLLEETVASPTQPQPQRAD